ncbi:unnamed protein product [Linum tenue]|uniref:Uncharacterized protein n=1 Tax=Linum tenue TaxID=586396 RepID=A0AAV0RFF2_9ROSI|nr:unnamed protein product [Linum tenue]
MEPSTSRSRTDGGGGGSGGREDCWSEGATESLIEAWGERYVSVKGGNLRQKDWNSGRKSPTKSTRGAAAGRRRLTTSAKTE